MHSVHRRYADRALSLALALSWDRHAEALPFFERVEDADFDDNAREWHARAALWAGDWKLAARSISAMSDGTRRSARWRYWAARIAEQDGWGLTEAHKAELLQRLAKNRVVRRSVGKATVTHRYGGLMQEFHRATETVTVPGRDPNKPLTAGEVRAEAVRRDFEYLRRWANDQWHFVGVVVTLLGDDEDLDGLVATDFHNALWGIADCDPAYAREVADDLIDEVVRAAHNEFLEAEHWAARDVTTDH